MYDIARILTSCYVAPELKMDAIKRLKFLNQTDYDEVVEKTTKYVPNCTTENVKVWLAELQTYLLENDDANAKENKCAENN